MNGTFPFMQEANTKLSKNSGPYHMGSARESANSISTGLTVNRLLRVFRNSRSLAGLTLCFGLGKAVFPRPMSHHVIVKGAFKMAIHLPRNGPRNACYFVDWRWQLPLLLCWLSAGCAPSTGPQPTNAGGGKKVASATSQGHAESATDEWAVIYMEEQPVGTIHTQARETTESGRTLVRTRSTTKMTLQRMGQLTEVLQVQESVETEEGELVRFRSEMKNGTAALVIRGQVAGDHLVSVVEPSTGTKPNPILWKSTYRGFFGPDQIMRANPMQPGESRVLEVLFPGLTSVQVVETRLTALDFEETKVASGTKRLLKVTSTLDLAGQAVQSSLWIDDAGVQWKAEIPGVGVVLRVDEKPAPQQNGAPAVDLSQSSFVPLARKVERVHETRRIEYQVRLKTNDPAKAFHHDTRQQVVAVDKNTARVTVDASAGKAPLDDRETPPEDADRSENSLIQSQDPLIQRMASQVTASEADPWRIATALESHVRRSMRRADFSTAFASAAEVAKTLRGDCSEHAVLLTALCRARSIPARVATGLVYVSLGNRPGFGFHMWTEVWIQDRWLPLDATIGRGGIGCGHLKLTHSNLSSGAEVSAILSVLPVLRQVQIEIREGVY